MRVLFVVDARSPIALNWIRHFVITGHDVHVVSSHACRPRAVPGAKLYQLPIAFGGISRSNGDNGAAKPGQRAMVGIFRTLDRATKGKVRSWLTPLDLLPHVPQLRKLCDTIAPDLVHAMRIPYEGILASLAVRKRPLLISCWGNDFTLFTATAPDRFLTRIAMQRTEALHCDCQKDIKLAYQWGFDQGKPATVLPGAGGVDMSVFYPGEPAFGSWRPEIPLDSPLVINPRGIRSYVRNDSFFRAIPLVLREEPKALFICPGMQGESYAERMVRNLGIAASVRLLPAVSRDELANMFRAAQVSVSPSTHDGTPNTLLEAMASGCLPLAGDIESVREWVIHGRNGILFDPASAESIAAALVAGLRDSKLRAEAARHNVRLAMERAEYSSVMLRAEGFYHELVERFSARRSECGFDAKESSPTTHMQN
jgi:glycosyltransferase involved in cell wall biosynthesis